MKKDFRSAAGKWVATVMAGFTLASGVAVSRALADEELPPPQPTVEKAMPVPEPVLREENIPGFGPDLSRLAQPACLKDGKPVTASHEDKALSAALEEMKSAGITGQALYNFAISRSVTFCSVTTLGGGIGADYDPQANRVNIQTHRPMVFKLASIISGTMRAVQKENGTLALDTRQDFHQWLRQSLYAEAAAQTAEIAVAFELKNAGKPALWDMLSKPQGAGDWKLMPVKVRFESEYAAMTAAKKPPSLALMQASSRAWEAMFDVQGWVDFHAAQTLAGYLKMLESGGFDGQKAVSRDEMPPEKQVVMLDVMAGKFDRNLNLTRFVHAPREDLLLFGGNDRLLLAAEAVELARYVKTNGRDAPETARIQMAAEEKKNPYLGLELSSVVSHWSARSATSGSMESAMDQAAAAQKDGRVPLLPRQEPRPQIKPGFK